MDSSGNATRIRYGVWGAARDAVSNLPTSRMYTGQEKASNIGLYYYNARWYDSYLNRWIQPDSIIPDPYNPLDMDRYAYVRINPVNFNDPSGHSTKAIFAGDGDAWKPPLAYYGVTLSEGWTTEDLAQIAAEVQMIANRLTSLCPDGNCFGMAPHEVFRKVFGETTIYREYDGKGIGCGAGNPIECSEGTGGQLILYNQNGLVIHEFGHNFDHKIDGWGFARNTLGNSTISVNGFHVSGYNPGTRTYERTERGYRSDNRPDVQHPLSMDETGNTSGEDFADMFMNFIRGSFSNDPFGAARDVWMTGNMTYWMQTISSGW